MISQAEKSSSLLFRVSIYSILLVGIVLRAYYFFSYRSLWYDEATLALNIINKSFLEFLQPLDYLQYAPSGFLIIEKIIITFFGTSEYALRFFPFFSSILSIILFYKLTKYCLSGNSILISNGLFNISVALIYYSSELKQYSSDLLFTLIIFICTIKLLEKNNLGLSNVIAYGILGAILIWFSHPVLFILAGIGAYTLYLSVKKEVPIKISYLFISYSLWMISFMLFYITTLNPVSENKGLADFWSSFYFPVAVFSDSGFKICSRILKEFFRFLSLDQLVVLPIGLGIFSFIKRNKKKIFFLLISPVVFLLIASVMHKYPLYERFLLFLFPTIIIFLAEGIEFLNKRLQKVAPVLGILLICLLFIKPFQYAVNNFKNPITLEDIRPVFKYLSEHIQNGDIVYVPSYVQPTLKYYAPRYNLCNDFTISLFDQKLETYPCKSSKSYILVLGANDIKNKNYINELDIFQEHKRIWFLFSDRAMSHEKVKTLQYLNKLGIRLDSFLRKGASVYLYNL